MRKKILTLIAAAAMIMAMSITAFAAGWVQDSTGWWWDNGDGTWPISEWKWLDGNNDGEAERYYFGSDGYLLTNTYAPDGLYVGENGAWEEYGHAKVELLSNPKPNKIISDNSTATKSADEIIAYLEQFRDPGQFIKDNNRVRLNLGVYTGWMNGWRWYGLRYYSSFDGFVCALAFDDDGYLMTNTTTPDGYQTNEYGQLIINGEVVMHDTECLAANEFYGLYEDGTRFTDPNTVDTSKLGLIATSSYQNATFNIYPRPFEEPLRYNHVNDINGWGLGYNTCVEAVKQAYPETAGDESYYVATYITEEGNYKSEGKHLDNVIKP